MIRALLPRAFLSVALIALAGVASAQGVPKPDDVPSATAPVQSTLCPYIVSPFRFCGVPPEFVLTPQNDNPDISAYFATLEDILALVIVEPFGISTGFTIPGLQDAALEVLAAEAGIPASWIQILERTTVPIAGAEQPNLVYSGVVDGVAIVYSNSIVLLDNALAQFITLEFNVTTYTPRHRDLHTRFLANVQVTP
ncbi:MAG: hypothetical protein JKY00_10795 [Roseicyclus sp.]|nr:hypothetical protein [Roseicyclus sp.]